MAVRVVRLGTPKDRAEGLRLGTVRLLPRGVRKQDYAKLNFFDVWLPEVSPGRALVSYARAKPWTDASGPFMHSAISGKCVVLRLYA